MAQRSVLGKLVGWLTLPVLCALNLALIFLFRGFPVGYLTDLGVMLWLAPVPGVLLVLFALSLAKRRVTWLAAMGLGIGLGLGVTPSLFVMLRWFGSQQRTAVVVSVLNLVLLTALLFLWRSDDEDHRPIGLLHAWKVGWGSFLFVTIFLQLYNFNCINFAANGDLHARDLFAIDLPYLVGQFASLKHYVELRDLHQLATPMFYHDFAYIFLVAVGTVTKRELFDITVYIYPIFGYSLFAFSTYALCYPLSHNRRNAALTVAAMFLLGSFVGTEQGSYALSPSFVFGSILFLVILQCVRLLLMQKRELPRALLIGLLTLLLLILSRSKLSTFAVLMLAFFGYGVVQLFRKELKQALVFGVPIFIAGGMFLLSSPGQSPYMPAGDFLIGAPLLGYANHLSSLLHVPIATINPVSHGLAFSLRQLLIIPYFIVHLLRFIVMDGRMLVILLLLVVLRKKIASLLGEEIPMAFFWLMIALIPIGFFMPVLYSPAWYPLAFSFYAPLVGIVAATILAVTLTATLILKRAHFGSYLPAIAALLLAASCVGNLVALERDRSAKETTIPGGMIEGLRYIRDHSMPTDVIASRRYDLTASDSTTHELFYLYSAFSERPVISEGAAYGVLLGSVAAIDHEKGLHRVRVAEDTLRVRRATLDSIYLSTDSLTVRSALMRYGAKFILVDKTIGQRLALDPRRVAGPFFDNDALTIWKVRD